MIVLTLSILLVLTFSYYLSFLWRVWRGLKFTARPGSSRTPSVSVIIAARNEGRNIQRCLDALIHQDYGSDHYEIIVIDDHSSDHTRNLALEYSMTITRPRIKVLALEEHQGEGGKPAAIAHGIETSDGEIILCTDADCFVPNSWIRSMAGCFDPSVVFVAGPVRERAGTDLFTSLQSLEFLGLLTTAAGLIGSGSPIICNGANIGYRKEAFQRVRGYARLKSSCDDETLMQRMITKNIGRVVFNSDPDAMVSTDAPPSIAEFWSQRTRWAAKRGRYEDLRVLLRLVALYAFFLTAFLAAVGSLMFPALRALVLAVAVLKGLAEFVVLQSGARLFASRLTLSHFLIAEVFHVPYIVFAAAIGQMKSIRWKDRTLDQ